MTKKINLFEKVSENLRKEGRAALEVDKEILMFKRVRDCYVTVFSHIRPESASELELYRETTMKRLSLLPGGYRRHLAVITLKRMMPMSRVEELHGKSGLDVIGFKIQGTHDFITMSKYPIDGAWISTAEAKTRESKLETGTLEQDERFSLVEGVVAVYVNATRDALEDIAKEDDIYIVDVGPQEHMDNLAASSIGTDFEWKPVLGPLHDVAFFASKFSVDG